MRKTIITLCLLSLFIGVRAQVALKSEGLDAEYVKSITDRSQKIVDKLDIKDQQTAENVLHIICNRYFLLNSIHEACAKKVKVAKDSLTGNAKNEAIQNAHNQRDADLFKHHFELAADLSLYLSDEKVEAVKDGMTYGVVKVTYDANLEMIPSLKDEEKAQILAWLKEAREFAMDAENSQMKHKWFGKYKGRINNYLSKRGYDLVKEREGWYQRIETKKNKKK